MLCALTNFKFTNMDRKGSRKHRSHAARQRKRSFAGNRHTIEQDTGVTSASAAKLRRTGDTEIRINRSVGYCILNFFTVFSAISEFVICKECQQDVRFTETSVRGLGFKIALKCQCNNIKYIPSCPLIESSYEINRRIVFAMRLLGIGFYGLQLFCGIMDLGKGMAIRTYYACLENLHLASKTVYDLSLQQAVAEEKEKTAAETGNALHLSVSGDGTWKERGFSALPLLLVNFQKKLSILLSSPHFVKDVIFGVIRRTQLNTTNGLQIMRKPAKSIMEVALVKWK